MRRRIVLWCLTMAAMPNTLFAGAVTPLREDWQLQSACKLQSTGEAISTDTFQPDGWLKTTVPARYWPRRSQRVCFRIRISG